MSIRMHYGLLDDPEKTALLAKQILDHDNGCGCVILNTVKQAQKAYEVLSVPDDEKMLFHARFSFEDRERLTNRLLKYFGKQTDERPERFLLVATQVVEQSLDVDFDFMISQIAPIDLLLQRSGRMHRHRVRSDDPVLHVLSPDSNSTDYCGTGYVYAAKPLLRTSAILSSISQIRLPEDFRPLIESCYGDETWEQALIDWEYILKADQEWKLETEELQNTATQFTLQSPSNRFYKPVNNTPTGDDSDDGNGWRARTRLGANDKTVILVAHDQIDDLDCENFSMQEIRKLYRRAVKIPSWVPLGQALDGYSSPIEGTGKLRGVIILPLNEMHTWKGVDERNNCYEVSYSKKLGLRAGRIS